MENLLSFITKYIIKTEIIVQRLVAIIGYIGAMKQMKRASNVSSAGYDLELQNLYINNKGFNELFLSLDGFFIFSFLSLLRDFNPSMPLCLYILYHFRTKLVPLPKVNPTSVADSPNSILFTISIFSKTVSGFLSCFKPSIPNLS